MIEFVDPRLDQDYQREFRSYLDKSLMILSKNPQNEELRIELINIYNDSIAKANDYYKFKDHRNALKYFLYLYEIHKRFSRIIHESDSSTKKENHILNVILNIAECHFHLNNLKESLEFYCAHCSMISLSAELANYKISDYQDLITIIDKILLISQTLKNQKIFDDFTELKTEFLQEINWMNYFDKINGHLRFSSINLSFKNDKLASKHLENALDAYSEINAQNLCNSTLKNISIGDLFYKYQFFENAITIYYEGYSTLQNNYDHNQRESQEIKEQILTYLFRIAECQLNLSDIVNTNITIKFISDLDENNDELKLLIDRLNKINPSSNLIPHQIQLDAVNIDDQILPVDKIANEEADQSALNSIRIDPEVESSSPDQSFLDISSIPRINSVDITDLVVSDDNIHIDLTGQNQSSKFVNSQLGFLQDGKFLVSNNDDLLFSNIDDLSELHNSSKPSENARVTASVVILTDSSPYRQNEDSVHVSFTSIDPDEDRPSPISATQTNIEGNRSQSLLRAGCSDKCVIS
jgi:hypothetical protein